MILKRGEDIGFQATLSSTYLLSGSCSYQLAGEGGERQASNTHTERPHSSVKVARGKKPFWVQRINLESFAYKIAICRSCSYLGQKALSGSQAESQTLEIFTGWAYF